MARKSKKQRNAEQAERQQKVRDEAKVRRRRAGTRLTTACGPRPAGAS